MKEKQKKKTITAKRLMSLILAAVLTVTLLPTTVYGHSEAEASDVTLSNPRIVADDSMDAGQKVTWDCVWFGSYPQAEVMPSGGYTALAQNLQQQGDIIISDSIYGALQSARGWDANNEIILNGTKYRRMQKGDATYSNTSSSYYQWSDSTTYHYFQYEPIKWRVLHTDGKQALLLADKALDNQSYNTVIIDAIWESSTIRSWLNGYDSSMNQQSADYSQKNFINSAFTLSERGAIVNSSVENADNITYGTEGGNNTIDKVFLLSESEVWNTDKAVSYGFKADKAICDEARRSQSTTYAKAMGISSNTSTAYKGNCWWWLRSPANHGRIVMNVNSDGYVRSNGSGNIKPEGNAVRVALNLNLSASDLYSYAGTVCSDDTSVFNASVYRANYMLSRAYMLDFLYDTTPSGEFSKQAEATGLSTKAQAWDTMKKITDSVEDPTKIGDNALSQKDFYEGIIFSLFEESAASSSNQIEKIKNMAGIGDDLLSVITTDMKALYNINIHKDNAVSSLSEKQIEKLQEISETFFNEKGIVKSAEIISQLVEAIEYVEDIGEYCEYISNCAQIVHLSESYKKVLQDMRECSSDNSSLKLALEECVSIMEMSEEEFVGKMSKYE